MNIELGPALFVFSSFPDWVNHAKARFAGHRIRGEQTACVDQKGRLCNNGGHFMQARDENAFPITVYAMRP